MGRLSIAILLIVVLLTCSIVAGCGPTKGTAEWHLEQGNNFLQQGRYDEAIEEYTEAIRLDPQYALAYHNRGFAYDDLGQLERAIQDYDEAIRLNPQWAEAYNNRGWTYEEMGQYELAIEDYTEAIRLNPQYALAYANRAGAYTLLDMDSMAEQDFNRAVELGFNHDRLKEEIERLKRQR